MASSRGSERANLRYSAEGLWTEVHDDLAIVGLTDCTQAALGPVVDIKLLHPGAQVSRSELLGTVEASKVAFDLFSPLSGEVVEVNQRLTAEPELVNRRPCSEGWLVKIRLQDTRELDGLLSAQQYEGTAAPSLRRRFQAPHDRGY